MSGPELMQYRSLFHGLNEGRPVSRSQADGVFAKASLPRDEVDYIWLLSDLDMDGLLLADEFAVALHIAAARFKGAPLPEELPRGLMPDGVEFNPRNSQVEAASVAAHSGGGVPGEASAAKSRWRMGGSASRIATGRNAAPPQPQQQQHYAHTGGGMAGGAYSRAGVLKHEKKARHCVLDGQRFSIYKGRGDTKPQLVLLLRTDVQRVWPSNQTTFSLILDPNRPGAKQPKKPGPQPPEKLEFTAETPHELNLWVETLQSAIAAARRG